MTFEETVETNKHNIPIGWWARFAYHYTDITNAVEILNAGSLYSRIDATSKGVMHNDNASYDVINITSEATCNAVRFYFRPQTPTQFHNEGFKHKKIRLDKSNTEHNNANVPVPIFFVFDIVKLLKDPNTRFTEISQAGQSTEKYSGEQAFSKLPFEYIYSTCAMPITETYKTKKYRQAEILYPHEYKIDLSLFKILCRNNVDKASLLCLLKEKNINSYNKYKNYIAVCKKDMFERNGLFIENIVYCSDKIDITFSNTYAKKAYVERYMQSANKKLQVQITIVIEWKAKDGNVLQYTTIDTLVDYIYTKPIVLNEIPKVPNAQFIRMTVYAEESLICCFEQEINPISLI